MCSGADTPKDEKQGNIEANMVHVYTPPPTTTLIIFIVNCFGVYIQVVSQLMNHLEV